MGCKPGFDVHIYAIRLYELLKLNDFFEVSELQKLLGTNYKRSTDFKRFTIKRAVTWINRTFGYDISYKFIAVNGANRFVKFFLPKGFGAFVRDRDDVDLDFSALYKKLGIDV